MERVLNAFGVPLEEVVLGWDGKPLILNAQEQRIADFNQRICNALGLEINITTLTTVLKKISEQKFYHIAFADYVPTVVGEGAWSTNILTYRAYDLADDFTTGIINQGANNARLATADAGVDSVNLKVYNWAKSIGWTLIELQQAAKAGNWDLVTQKEVSRKTNWDLGLQKVSFLGIAGDTNCLGLLNQPGITFNTSLLSGSITALAQTPSNLSTFIGNLLGAYRANCARTAWPTHLIIPESDFLGLATPSSPTYPLKSILQLMLETLITMTGNKNFQILPCSYADYANSSGVLTKQTYTLLNYDEKSVRMNIPVDYTNTLANSLDNFAFQNAGYGQFTGVQSIRPNELFYFGY